jgi:rSAM/selenodomain-associated transferase 1
MQRAIIIMAKVPLAGTVKTRLQAVLSPEKCAALAEAFLRDALEKAQSVCKNVILAYSPASGRTVSEEIAAPGIRLNEQKGDDLGARMKHAFETAFAENSPVLMIGTDSPTFPANYLTEAFTALENDSEIVLGKSADGGFYLIGSRKPQPKIFDNIEWSTPQVFEQITANIEKAGIGKLHFVSAHYDVDTPEDFAVLLDELRHDENARKTAEETCRWLTANGFL